MSLPAAGGTFFCPSVLAHKFNADHPIILQNVCSTAKTAIKVAILTHLILYVVNRNQFQGILFTWCIFSKYWIKFSEKIQFLKRSRLKIIMHVAEDLIALR